MIPLPNYIIPELISCISEYTDVKSSEYLIYIYMNSKSFLKNIVNVFDNDVIINILNNILKIDNNWNMFDIFINNKCDKKQLFILSCGKGNINIIKYFTETLKININSTVNNYYGFLEACKYNRIDVVKYLISKGCDVNVTDCDEYNGLMWACEEGYLELTKFLLKTSIDINCASIGGYNCIMLSCLNNNTDITELLLTTKIDILHKDNDEWNIFFHICRNNNIDLAKKFIKIYPRTELYINEKDYEYNTPLLYSCCYCDVELVRLLLQNGADINDVNNNYNDCFVMACQHNNIDVVELLLKEYKCNPNEKDCDGDTVLILACRDNDIQLAEMLIKYGADINMHNEEYLHNPFTIACWKGNHRIVNLLLQNDVDVEYKDNDGNTGYDIAEMEFDHIEHDNPNYIHYRNILFSIKNKMKALR